MFTLGHCTLNIDINFTKGDIVLFQKCVFGVLATGHIVNLEICINCMINIYLLNEFFLKHWRT